MREVATDKAQITTDGRVVWVNSSTGMCIGRFTKGIIDVHHDIEAQIAGKHCLDCRPASGDLEADWLYFVASMKRHHDIDVPLDFKPKEKR